MPTTWTRGELIELARIHRVGARNEHGEYTPLPAWLAAEAVDEATDDLLEFIGDIHPDDRVDVIEMFGQAQSQPGERLTVSIRMGPVGQQRLIELSLINLLDDDDVAAIVAVMVDTDTVITESFDDDSSIVQRPVDWMILELASSGVIVHVEGGSSNLLGYSAHDMVGRVPAEFMQADDILASIQMIRALRAEPDVTRTARRRWVRRDGSVVWTEVSYATRNDPLPGQGEIINVVWDITEKMAAEQALRDSEADVRRMAENFRALADEVPAAVFQCRRDGTVVFHNARWSRLLEQHRGVERVHDLIAADDRHRLDQLVQRLGRASSVDAETVELGSSDGCTVWRLTMRSLSEAGEFATFMGSLEDVTTTVRLRDQATQDPLTGLLNRSAIEVAVAEALDDAARSTTVAFLDLDRFKTVNDTWGHEAGDAVLVHVADCLQRHLRPGDVAGRWGGDEFVLLLVDRATVEPPDAPSAHQVLERVRRSLQRPLPLDGASWVPEASIGVVDAVPGDDLDEVIRRADHAMFGEKRQRRTNGNPVGV